MARRESTQAYRGDAFAAFWEEKPSRPARSSRKRTRRQARRRARQNPRGRTAQAARRTGRAPAPRRQSQTTPRAAVRTGSRPAPRGASRKGPRARGGSGPADRLSTGAVILSIVVGLGLLAVVERSLLEGGPLGPTATVGAEGKPGRPRARAAVPDDAGRPRRAPAPVPQRRTAPPQVAAPDPQALAEQVRQLTVDERGPQARQEYGTAPDRRPLVSTARLSPDRTWAFGTTAVPVPAGATADPEVAFFAARWNRGRWQPALSGTPAFGALVARMPVAMMSPDEGRALARYGAVAAGQAAGRAAARDGLMLPWKIGATWTMGTPAAGATTARPLGALAFWGGDGRVLAAGDGRLYRFCGDASGGGLVMVLHPSGLATTYYRMRGVTQIRDGSVVRRGEPLGLVGAERPCGGAPAPRPEVQFALRRGAERVPFDGVGLGGWTFRERARPLLGYAERGPLHVLPGGLLANLGPVPAAPGTAAPPTPAPDSPEQPETTPPGGSPSPAATQNRSSSSAESEQ
ncbi:M23 family metallopeptidase [Actinomadura hibisca]|uniref:M23 family metallopeptidase n=1 Tax=Actinomadura hibisca TaxID=68565 RepID=UPI000832D03D|nr:M23 family metallopeptidase [Actinomadura hibisca]